ncbi:MAG: hypothetical protein KAS39_01255 [Actinomycetia bacterium]|nr:hypothetical protein [Actinomycetes bacterium]
MSGDNHEFKNLDARALVGTVDSDSGAFPYRKAIIIDPYTHSLMFTDYSHHEIHAGEHHIAAKSAILASGGTLDIMFKVDMAPKLANMKISIDGALAYTLNFWGRNSTSKLFVPGNTVQFANRNHHLLAASPTLYTSSISLCHTAGGTEDNSTTFGPIYVGSATSGGRADVGGESGSRDEIITEDKAWYRAEVISRAADNGITIYLDWYEHAPRTAYPYNPVGWPVS